MRTPSDILDDSNRLIAQFAETEIETALLFCHIASTRTGDNRAQLLAKARQALDVAEERIWKLKMPHAQFDEFTANLESLRFEFR